MSKEITHYKLVGGFNSDELSNNINEAIKEGWQPYEQPFIILDEIVQPCVRYKEVDTQSMICNALKLHG